MSNLLVSSSLYLTNIPQMWFMGGPSFLGPQMSFLELLQLNHNHYVFIRHLVHWDQIQLGSS